MIKTECLSLEEVILVLWIGIGLGTVFSARLGNLRKKVIGAHFYGLEKEIRDDIDLETAQLLLSNNSPQIEVSLYDFVHSRCENDL